MGYSIAGTGVLGRRTDLPLRGPICPKYRRIIHYRTIMTRRETWQVPQSVYKSRQKITTDIDFTLLRTIGVSVNVCNTQLNEANADSDALSQACFTL